MSTTAKALAKLGGVALGMRVQIRSTKFQLFRMEKKRSFRGVVENIHRGQVYVRWDDNVQQRFGRKNFWDILALEEATT